MLRLIQALILCAVASVAACHPGPVLSPKANVGGTIAGMVATDANSPLPGRKVTAVDVATGARHEATTGVNGGFTIKVPEGTYRLEVELRADEAVAKQPGETRVQKSDLDPRRDFTITIKR
jgi:hypothetical protein